MMEHGRSFRSGASRARRHHEQSLCAESDCFASRVAGVDPGALTSAGIDLLMLNLGLRCNMRCAHCHQSSSPERDETLSDELFSASLALGNRLGRPLLDLTGGAPELHPHIRDFLRRAHTEGFEVQLRTNLTALLEPGCEDLTELFASLGVRLLASIPSWDPLAVERQRGDGAFQASLRVMKRLNGFGYGMRKDLRLDVAVNPDGALLPERKEGYERRFRHELEEGHGIHFHGLLLLTNMPLGRFRDGLDADTTRRSYLDTLRRAFNPETVPHLACRRSLTVAWDGILYDCDFNLGARLPIRSEQRSVLQPPQNLLHRPLAFGSHCFACTAAAGSS